MSMKDLDEIGRRFLLQLYTETNGDPSAQVSMYDIGSVLGLDRDDASRIAEDLMGWEFVEIRTLSGSIAIHPDAVEEIRSLAGAGGPGTDDSARLGNDPVLTQTGKQVLELLAEEVKDQAGKLGLGFDALSELMTDLKTIDMQLESPRPKTAIFKACIRSIIDTVAQADAKPLADRLKAVIED